jgi:hypothetical protein
VPKFDISISDVTLRQMEEDAGKAKAELNLATHVRTLTAEIRRLAQQVEEKPTLEQAQVALDVAVNVDVLTGDPLYEAARDVLRRFLS